MGLAIFEKIRIDKNRTIIDFVPLSEFIQDKKKTRKKRRLRWTP